MRIFYERGRPCHICMHVCTYVRALVEEDAGGGAWVGAFALRPRWGNRGGVLPIWRAQKARR